MKTIGATLIILVGVACIVFGVMFMMQANDARDRVATEIAPLEISGVDAAYGQASAALKANTDPNMAFPLALQKTSLGLAKANIGTIKFLQNSGILNIVIGAGFAIAGLVAFKKG